jgi:hypothetical protein
MSDLRTELRHKWHEARSAIRAGHEWRGVALVTNAPVRFLAGIREPDERISLLLEAPLECAPPEIFRLQAEGISVADQRRPDEGIFRLATTLESEELRDVFEVLAADIICITTPSADVWAAIRVATRRLLAWQACLRSRRLGLSVESQLGLFGELVILQDLAGQIGYSAALEAWEGPADGLHDFTRRGIAIEVKSLLGVGNLLRISRLDQLESKGLSRLVIARPKFREDAVGQSLCAKVAEVRSETAHTQPAAVSTLEERLLRAGYLDSDAAHYDDLRLLLYELYGFEVANDFPRLTMSTVPSGIIDGAYAIDERVISSFRLDAAILRRIMKSMDGMRQ